MFYEKSLSETSIFKYTELMSNSGKINNIIKMLNKEVQTFITSTDIDRVNKDLLNDSYIFYINNGKIERID